MRVTALIVMITSIMILGCGPQMANVSGNISIDGAPLDKGIISYAPDGDAGEAITANIENGRYSLEVLPGKKIVQISAPRVIGTRKISDSPDSPLSDITEEQLPDRYHVNSELRFEVVPGANTKDWSVESIQGKR